MIGGGAGDERGHFVFPELGTIARQVPQDDLTAFAAIDDAVGDRAVLESYVVSAEALADLEAGVDDVEHPEVEAGAIVSGESGPTLPPSSLS